MPNRTRKKYLRQASAMEKSDASSVVIQSVMIKSTPYVSTGVKEKMIVETRCVLSSCTKL